MFTFSQLLKTSFKWEHFCWLTNKKFIFSAKSKHKKTYSWYFSKEYLVIHRILVVRMPRMNHWFLKIDKLWPGHQKASRVPKLRIIITFQNTIASQLMQNQSWVDVTWKLIRSLEMIVTTKSVSKNIFLTFPACF